ncbi:MAG: DUF4886 domain-containing protein [Bacteroidales bacterium]|nr:DUF4886 domain-containing protein [Bacteroidales bacterium]
MLVKKSLKWLLVPLMFLGAVSCSAKPEPGPGEDTGNGPECLSFDIERVDSLNRVCNYALSVSYGDDGSMEIALLRDGETISVSSDDLEAGLKVEDKGRYLLFSMPGKGETVLGSDIQMTYNPPLRTLESGGTLNILCIGNSLTADTVEHLPRMLKSMGIGNVNIDVVYHGGWSLLNHWTNFKDIKCSRYVYEAGKDDWTEFDPNALDDCGADILSLREYDVVTFQDDTRTNCVGWSAEAKAAFLELVDYVHHSQPSHRPSIVYFAPHCPAAKLYGSKNAILWEVFDGDQKECYEAFSSQIRTVLSETPVDLFFSNATAVQNLRTSTLNDSHPLDLSRDGTHSDYGVTRFCESVMFFQSILKPCLGVDIASCNYAYDKSESTPGKCATPVDDFTRPVAVEAALNAIEEPFSITRMSPEKLPIEGLVNYVLTFCEYPMTLNAENGGECRLRNAGSPVGLDWTIKGEAPTGVFKIIDGSSSGRLKIGNNSDIIDPFILQTDGLAGKKISKVSIWMSSGVSSKLSKVSIDIGDTECLAETEVALSVTSTKKTGFEYTADCSKSTGGEVKITVRSTAAFYIYKVYIDYE